MNTKDESGMCDQRSPRVQYTCPMHMCKVARKSCVQKSCKKIAYQPCVLHNLSRAQCPHITADGCARRLPLHAQPLFVHSYSYNDSTPLVRLILS